MTLEEKLEKLCIDTLQRIIDIETKEKPFSKGKAILIIKSKNPATASDQVIVIANKYMDWVIKIDTPVKLSIVKRIMRDKKLKPLQSNFIFAFFKSIIRLFR